MRKWEDAVRQVWSCRLWELPEEDETAQLEEELKGKGLSFVEDALTLRRYLRAAGCSQEEAARRLGRSQSSVANRLRLLKLPEDVLADLQDTGLTERHGRALLRLESPEHQRLALEVFYRDRLSVTAAEAYVEALAVNKANLRCAAITDIGVLLTSLNRDLDTLRRCGVEVNCQHKETADEWMLFVSIPKPENTLKKS